MDDPREFKGIDAYGELTSDEGEEVELQKQIEDIERQKQDLLERLKNKRFAKPQDSNFTAIQVENSPIKKKQTSIRADIKVHKETTVEKNLNELKIQNSKNVPTNSTSYFMQKFCNSKKESEIQAKEHLELLSSRVHTFTSLKGKQTYQRVVTNEQEEYSDLWINQRYIPKKELREVLHEIKMLRLGKLFAKIKPPKFTEPKYSNWAVIGIISSKGDVKFSSAEKPKKYIKFTLTDFQHSLDVLVFGKEGVERYYNLRVGDLIAILNPEILPWRPTGKGNFIKSFNLRISHKFPCILEIGSSRDLGWCSIINKSQSKPCGMPINKSKEECCDYHREIQFRGVNAKRIELNGSFALGAPTKIDARPALYREGQSGLKRNFKMLPNWSHRGTTNRNSEIDHKGLYFSNNNAAKAFFDERFHNPDILNNLDSKRRKISDNRKSNNLERELRKVFGKADATGLYDDASGNYDKVRETTEATLQTGLIQNLGFDPTHGKIAAVLRTHDSDKSKGKALNGKQTAVSALLKFKKENVHLKPSKDVVMKRKRQREKVWQEHFGDQKERAENDPNSSQSDLEIVE